MNSSHPSWLVRTLLVCSALSSGTASLAQAASISEIEVNQVLGKARAADGSVSPASRFVAGKETVVRVFLGSKVKVDTSGKTQSLKVTLGDDLLATLFPAANPA